MINKKLKIGTRGSKLALWQAEHVRTLLSKANPEFDFEIVVIKTTGDEFGIAGGTKNVFIKEIEDALLNKKIDLAVHSLKDMSSKRTNGLTITSYLGGASRMDVLISNGNINIKALPKGARMGTGSNRRIAQVKLMRNDLIILPIRGNVDTRLRKLESGEYDAIILAEAGLERLGLKDRISYTFSVDEIVPAAGQGIIALETRSNDTELLNITKKINDTSVEIAAQIEFNFMKILGADCNVPLGVHAYIKGETITTTVFFSTDNKNIKFEKSFDIKNADKIPNTLIETLNTFKKNDKSN
ncbi:MAG: hydroxymethylbilane synthase [Candidatus Omnitrophica bacterium]|nr:hydroxymethylbilane synthase [Candidatus Omnitrophota bacterium]